MSDSLQKRLIDIDNELKIIEVHLNDLRTQKRKLLEERQRTERAIEQRTLSLQTGNDDNLWESESFPWSVKLREQLKCFHISSFRDMQLSAINATMSKEDVILLMSTGGGKSLCFQLPALVGNGFTLVISPLISLMEDQVMALNSLDIKAVMLVSTTSKEDSNNIQNAMVTSGNKTKMVYVTPEKLSKSKRFIAKLEAAYKLGRLDRIAIDEIHCCSQWGHDFRPDYKFLNILKRQFPNAPLLGLTATATAHVIDDVKEMLGIHGALVFRAGFNRKNLFYEVRCKPESKDEFLTDLVDLISNKFAGKSGIVYCFSRKESEELTATLRAHRIKALCYHADLEPATRSEAHKRWTENKCQVIVATVAFGMGIDKPDVRFVVHQSLPKSLENYYQESGRSGRDGLPARCILYYRYGDIFRQSTMVCTEKTGSEHLYAMVAYCQNETACRRRIIADHFGEEWNSEWCERGCDVCIANAPSSEKCSCFDVTHQIKEILAIVKQRTTGENRITALKLLELVLKDVKTEKSKPQNKLYYERLLVHLLLEGYLKEDFHFTPYSIISYISTGVKCRFLDDSNHKIQFAFSGALTTERKTGNRTKPTMSSSSNKKLKV